MIKDTNAFINIIDQRIRKILKEQNICYRYIGKVVTVGTQNSFAYGDNTPVQLLGFIGDEYTIYNFTNRSHSTLNVGDTVYIDTINGKMNSGVITQIYKQGGAI